MSSKLLILDYISAVIKNESKKPSLDRRNLKFAERIILLLNQNELEDLEFTEENELEVHVDEDIDPEYDPESNLQQEEQLFEGIGSPNVVLFGKTLVPISKVWEAVEYYSLDGEYKKTGQKRRKASSMFNRYRFLKSDYDLRRLFEYEKAGKVTPDRRAVIAYISAQLYERTVASIQSGHVLHDTVLQAMINEIKDEHQIECSFYGSHNWLNDWKRAHRISSRKITTFVSKKRFLDKQLMQDKMDKFVTEAKLAFHSYDPLRIYNLDQSGFQKELYTKRTLAETGTRIIEVVTSSATGIRHSYTILPMLRADGVLHQKLYVIFSEPSGSFPPTAPPFNAPNLVIRASKGSIMGKPHTSDFYSSILFENDVPDDTLLVVDSWPIWRNKEILESVKPAHKHVKMIVIPPGATGQIQPLDIGIFRCFKKFMKNLTEYAQRKNPEFKPHQRDSIIKMLSQSYYQLCCPVFQEWRYYAWYAGGYFDQQPPRFETPIEYCFNRHAHGKCSFPGCNRVSMAICSYCSKKFCFTHYVIDLHMCV